MEHAALTVFFEYFGLSFESNSCEVFDAAACIRVNVALYDHQKSGEGYSFLRHAWSQRNRLTGL